MRYVYLLKAGENHYKVGVAMSVNKRLKGIQTSNGNKVYVVTAKLCRNANEVEKRIHKALEKLATHGGKEWFLLEPEDVIRVAILINQEPEIDVFGVATTNDLIEKQNERYSALESKIDKLLGAAEIDVPKLEPVDDYSDEVLFKDAVEVIKAEQGASTSLLQRKLRIGYGRAARLMEELEGKGIIGPADGSRRRDVLIAERILAN